MSRPNAPRQSRAPRRVRPTPEQYAEFVGQIDLVDLWLVDARIINSRGSRAPRQAALAIATPESDWSNTEGGFDVRFPYSARFLEGDEVHAEIDVTFGLRFTSRQPMTSGIYSVFERINLPVNTWPFFREFVSTTVGRMGWQAFTLPAHKVGVPDEDGSASSQPVKRPRARRAADE